MFSNIFLTDSVMAVGASNDSKSALRIESINPPDLLRRVIISFRKSFLDTDRSRRPCSPFHVVAPLIESTTPNIFLLTHLRIEVRTVWSKTFCYSTKKVGSPSCVCTICTHTRMDMPLLFTHKINIVQYNMDV